MREDFAYNKPTKHISSDIEDPLDNLKEGDYIQDSNQNWKAKVLEVTKKGYVITTLKAQLLQDIAGFTVWTLEELKTEGYTLYKSGETVEEKKEINLEEFIRDLLSCFAEEVVRLDPRIVKGEMLVDRSRVEELKAKYLK